MYGDAEIQMKPGNKAKYQEFCDRLNAFWDYTEPPRGKKHDPEPHIRLYAHDDKIVIKFLMMFPESISPLKHFDVPNGIKEGLKDVDQFVKVKVLTGVDAKEILSSGKPLAEHALNGFSV